VSGRPSHPDDQGDHRADREFRAADTNRPESLPEAQNRFVEAWGRMGGVWGVSRTMAEVHALLYITGQPLCTDDVMDRLEISRGNASMSLRSLVDWNLVTRTRQRGDRRERFDPKVDVDLAAAQGVDDHDVVTGVGQVHSAGPAAEAVAAENENLHV
jgi:hypothetical protein